MALFTDGPASGLEDLTAQDTQLQNVANVEGIDVTQKLSLAHDELSLELSTMVEGWRGFEQAFWPGSHPGVGNIVVTPALKLWHTFRTLEMVYRDAYSNQLNDRYGSKRDQFRDRAKWARERLELTGIGMALRPLAQAGPPAVINLAGGMADGTYYLTMTWTNEAGDEGAPSVTAAITTTGNTLLVQPAAPPTNAASWNIYMGQAPETMSRQNESPIANGEPWRQPDAVSTGGRTPGCGQLPSYVKPVTHTIMRG